MKCIGLDKNNVQQFSNKTLFNFCNKALKNYVKFRISLMQNKTVQNIEKEILEASVKAGIKYAESKFGVNIPEQGEEQIQQMAVDIAKAINERRIDLFLYGLEYATHNLEKDSASNETNS
jgi:ribosome recycling factor